MMSARCPPVAGARGVMTQPTASSASSLPSPERHARILLSGEEKKYKGVRRRKWGRWVSEIRLPNSRDGIWLGSYDTPSKAARAFDAAYLCLRGPGGGGDGHGLNFPDSPPPLVARTTHPREVHAAAVSHANRAAAAAPPLGDDDATEPPPSEPMQARAPLETTAAAAAPSRLEVQQGSDWWWLQQVDDTTPLYSPANAYLFPALPVAADPDDGDMEENGSGACHDLWCFDSDEAPRI